MKVWSFLLRGYLHKNNWGRLRGNFTVYRTLPITRDHRLEISAKHTSDYFPCDSKNLVRNENKKEEF